MQTPKVTFLGFQEIAFELYGLANTPEKRKVERGLRRINDRFRYIGNLVAKDSLTQRVALIAMVDYCEKFSDYGKLCDFIGLDFLEPHGALESVYLTVMNRDDKNNINHVAVDIEMHKRLADMTTAERRKFLNFLGDVFELLASSQIRLVKNKLDL